MTWRHWTALVVWAVCVLLLAYAILAGSVWAAVIAVVCGIARLLRVPGDIMGPYQWHRRADKAGAGMSLGFAVLAKDEVDGVTTIREIRPMSVSLDASPPLFPIPDGWGCVTMVADGADVLGIYSRIVPLDRDGVTDEEIARVNAEIREYLRRLYTTDARPAVRPRPGSKRTP